MDLNLEDASVIEWAHAVNSRQSLQKSLTSSVDFLEADVSMGYIVGSPPEEPKPVMTHPPEVLSDISLAVWLDTVISRRTGKGIKLDFKSIEAVEPSLIFLQTKKIHFPVWLNADIIPGPIDAKATPVEASKFLKLCTDYFPNSTLSVGWTTAWTPGLFPFKWHYDWNQIKEMVDALQCSGIDSESEIKLTFPVRAIYATRSIDQLQWLLRMYPKSSSLTVWSHPMDEVKVDDLMKIRNSFDSSKVYYDLPNSLDGKFKKQLHSSKVIVHDLSTPSNNWWTIYQEDLSKVTCLSTTYSTENTIFFGKDVSSAVLLKNSFDINADDGFCFSGITHFVKSDQSPDNSFELTLALADVSLFNENDTLPLTNADNNVVWKNLNSSQLYNFQYGPSDSPSRYFFKLDTSMENNFQVWKLPSQPLDEEITDTYLYKYGTPQIDHRTYQLVLPYGKVMLGFMSTGLENVVVYGLKFKDNDLKSTGPLLAFASASAIQCHLILITLVLTIFFLL